MGNGFCFVPLLFLIAQAKGITKCVAGGGDMITCTFSVNVNKTQTAFGVYFYPDTGSEESLVDCDWWNGQLECIEQKGVNCKRPVSQHAIIGIPEKFAVKAGRFKWRTFDRDEDSNTCEFIHDGGAHVHQSAGVDLLRPVTVLQWISALVLYVNIRRQMNTRCRKQGRTGRRRPKLISRRNA